MADRRHELLRPEDATTWEEFQARWVIERGRYRAARRSCRLAREWEARAKRGEIPQASPGGPKVWRDDMGVEAPSP